MALTERKNMILCLGTECQLKLSWDDEIKAYRGNTEDNSLMGIFEVELLLQVIDGEAKNANLEIA